MPRSSAAKCYALARFLRAADAEGVGIVLAGASERLETALEKEVSPAVWANVSTEHDEDHALEQCEEIVLAKWRSRSEGAEHLRDMLLEQVVDDLARRLERQSFIEELLEELEEWRESREYGPGETMVAARGLGLR